MFCPNCGSQQGDGLPYCINCGTRLQSPLQPVTPAAPRTLSMGWFKFLINFSLWVSALIMLSSGLTTMSGLAYESSGITAAQVYAYYGERLKGLDITFGVLSLASAAFAIYTRFRLAKFKKDGPTYLYIFCLINIGLGIFYSVGSALIIDAQSFDFGSIVSGAVFLLINWSYFKKRTHLFVND